ncbi:MAG: hypothetical protein JW959_02375 [Pirellulales bacterium]|nr:hypothetical protein [Pirellulales bacterium]
MTHHISIAISLLCLSFAFVSETSADDTPTKPKITISKETTFITEPLDADGYPDYVAALNRHCSRGVTPENNAAVLVWRALGPKSIDADRREQYFKLLGIDPLPEKGEYFRTAEQQVALHETPKKDNEQETNEYYLDPLYEEFDKITHRPWSREEFPVWAEWLDVNKKPMELLTEASKRPRRFDPWFADKEENRAMDISLACTEYRDIARAFLARAMLRAHEGKIAEAREDLMNCHRLARLVGQGPMFVELLVGITIDSRALAGDRALIGHAKLPTRQIADIERELNALPPILKIAEVFDFGERLFSLSYSVAVVGKLPTDRDKLLKTIFVGLATDETPEVIKIFDIMGNTPIDWNVVLREQNSWQDRMVAAFRMTDRRERLAILEKLDKDLKALQKSAEDFESLKTVPPNELSKAGSRKLADAFVCNAVPSFTMYQTVLDVDSIRTDLTRVAFALAKYKADNDSYPSQLADLAPKYLAAVPKDVFNNDADLHYTREGDGYLLYSVGHNGRDDGGGKNELDEETGKYRDDIIVRVPAADD